MTILRVSVLVALLITSAAAAGRAEEPPAPVPLAEAVARFNERAREKRFGKEQPLLTSDAVVAAIRWAMRDREKLLVSDETFRALEEITRREIVPPGFDLELVTGYEPSDEVTFDVWSVRLRIPGGPHRGGTTCIAIDEKMIASRLIGEEERKVIREWQEKERKRGGVGSFERVDWMRRYHAERAAAAAKDRQK